jgi:hypothetical protein
MIQPQFREHSACFFAIRRRLRERALKANRCGLQSCDVGAQAGDHAIGVGARFALALRDKLPRSFHQSSRRRLETRWRGFVRRFLVTRGPLALWPAWPGAGWRGALGKRGVNEGVVVVVHHHRVSKKPPPIVPTGRIDFGRSGAGAGAIGAGPPRTLAP